MRLHELHIEGFGHFRDHVVEALDRKVTVLHGPNEAGKSTLLAFIRTMPLRVSRPGGVTATIHPWPAAGMEAASRWSPTRARATHWSVLLDPAVVPTRCVPSLDR